MSRNATCCLLLTLILATGAAATTAASTHEEALSPLETALRYELDAFEKRGAGPGEPLRIEATQATERGRLLLAADRLGSAIVRTEATRLLTEYAGWENKGKETFQAEWKKVGQSVSVQLLPHSNRTSSPRRVRLFQAWISRDSAQVDAYHNAAQRFANTGSLPSAYQSLALARATATRVEFLARLPVRPTTAESGPRDRHLDRKRILALLEEVELRLGILYAQTANREKASNFNRINANIGFARKLLDGGAIEGACLRALEAKRDTLRFADNADEHEVDLDEVYGRFQRELDIEEFDDSIGRFFLDSAAHSLARRGRDRIEARREARVLLEEVLPAYSALFRRESMDSADASDPQRRKAPREESGDGQETPTRRATLTIVRWPYT